VGKKLRAEKEETVDLQRQPTWKKKGFKRMEGKDARYKKAPCDEQALDRKLKHCLSTEDQRSRRDSSKSLGNFVPKGNQGSI